MTFFTAVIIALATTVGASSQAASRITRLGDIATALPDDDVAEIVRLAACGASPPLLLVSFRGMIANVQSAEVFCTADHANGDLRRGQLSWIRRDQFNSDPWSRWTIQERYRYAQLPAGRPFEQITGEQDLNRPFRLYGGEFTGEELISLVMFLRSGPKWTGGAARQQVETKWPVTAVGREADGTIVARLSKDVWQGQRVTLRRSANGWTIVGVNYWIV